MLHCTIVTALPADVTWNASAPLAGCSRLKAGPGAVFPTQSPNFAPVWRASERFRTFSPIGVSGKPLIFGIHLMNTMIETWTPRLLSVLRIVAGFLFVEHGMQKWLGLPVPRSSPTVLWSLSGVAGLFELVGGSLLLLGLFTRPVAFLLSGLMAFAYFIAHAPQDFWPIVNRGELAALYSFLFLYLSAAGGGPWSLDQWVRRK
jgi:putative oxidoreductase